MTSDVAVLEDPPALLAVAGRVREVVGDGELRPPGLEGVRVSVWSVTADGEQFAYNGIRQSRTLYVVK